jgi:hypothetical protein
MIPRKRRLLFVGVEKHIGIYFHVWRDDATGKRWASPSRDYAKQ